MFSSGLASSISRSARLPASMLPLSLSTFMARAGTMVAACSASIGVKPGVHVQLQLAIERVSGHRLVGSRDDGHSGAMQRADDRQLFPPELLSVRGKQRRHASVD